MPIGSAIANPPTPFMKPQDPQPSPGSSVVIQTAAPTRLDGIGSKLQNAGVIANSNSIEDIVREEKKNMFSDAKNTATWRGSKAYTASFGAYGLAGRAATWATNQATNSNMGTTATILAKTASMASFLSMPLAHGTAATKAAPTQVPVLEKDPTFCVQPDAKNPIKMGNLVGSAFAPFITNLSLGNSMVNATAQGLGMATNALASDSDSTAFAMPGGAGNSTMAGNTTVPTNATTLISPTNVGEVASGGGGGAGAIVEQTANLFGLFLPGVLAGGQTARNITSGQLALGFSLSQPLKTQADDDEGAPRIVVHQKPVEREDGTKELGHLSIKDGDNIHKFTAITKPNGQDDVEVQTSETPTPPAAESVGAKAKAFAKYFIPNNATVTKTVALASTLGAASAITMGVTPALKAGMIAQGTDPNTAQQLTKTANYVVSNMLLGSDFIPKFQTFTEPATTWGETFSKIAKAAIPVFGGSIAAGNRSAPEIPGLSEKQFEQIAANKADIMASVANFAQNNSMSGAVTRVGDEFAVDTRKLSAAIVQNRSQDVNI